MGLERLAARIAPVVPERAPAPLGDLRFRGLIGGVAWAALEPRVRARFGRRLAAGASVTYVGQVARSRKSWGGWLLAHACRLIGAPLPLGCETGGAAIVTITEDRAGGGQFWTRIYGRAGGRPQVIHSSKRFAGPTGIEEYLGCGFGIALRVRADLDALHFDSDHYFFGVGGHRVRLPRWMEPGAMTVSHVDRPDDSFEFVLALRHRLFGELIHQMGVFREAAPRTMGDGR